MALSYTTATGDGSTMEFTVPFPYLAKGHVHVEVDGVDTPFTWVTDTIIEIFPAPAAGTRILIYRSTSPSTRLVDYTSPSALTEEDLDADSLQAFYLAQEAIDVVDVTISQDPVDGHWDAQSKRIKNVADPEQAQDAATKAYVDAYMAGQGNVPIPDNPDDDGKVLTASGGTFDWQDLPNTFEADQIVDPENIEFTVNGGLFSAPLYLRFGDILNARRDFGLNPDGVTDNHAAFAAMFAACEGRTVFLPKGRYRVDLSTQGFLRPPANFTLVGEGPETVIEIYAKGDPGTRVFIRFENTNVAFRNLRIEGDLDTGITCLCFSPTNGHSGVLLEDVHIFGGVQPVSGAGNWIFDVFSLSGDSSDITVVRNHWDSVNWGFLKTNAATSTQRRIRIVDSLFTNMYSRPALFNTPSGIVDDVLVQGCTFKDSRMQEIGVSAHVAGGASVTNMRIIGCHFTGPNGEDILHFEEKCRGIVIADNTFDVDSGAIRILDNNVGGTDETPAFYTITGNVFRNTGAFRSYRGIELVHDGDGVHPLDLAIISNNVFQNYDIGLKMADRNNLIRVEGNLFRSCNIGVQPTNPSPNLQNNSFLACPIAIQLTNGGLVGPQFFDGCPVYLTSTSSEGALSGWSRDMPPFNLGTGTQDIVLAPAGTEFAGRLTVTWHHVPAVYNMATFDLSYDGNTLTGGTSPIIQRSTGGVAFNGIFIVNGDLVARFNNTTGSVRNNSILQARFEGIHFFD